MPVTGWRFANALSQITDASRVAWLLPRPAANLTALDTSVVPASLGGPGSTSQVLILTDWGFAAEIPVGAVIDGVEIETYIRSSAASRVDQVATCRLTLDGTTLPSTSQANTTSFSNTTPARVHGGAANTFGLSLTRAQVIAATFGIGFDVVRISGTAATSSSQIDMVRMRVHYTEAGGALSLQSVNTDTPTLGLLTINQIHNLSLQGVSSGAPIFGNMTISQIHNLSLQGISTSNPTVGNLTINQIHNLILQGITATPTVADLSISAAGNFNFQGVSSGAPTVGNMAISQIHNLTFQGISVSPTVGNLTINQIHNLILQGISSGAPTVGNLTFTDGEIDLIIDFIMNARWTGRQKMNAKWTGQIKIERQS